MGAEPIVHSGETIVILGPVVSHGWDVGVVWRNLNLGRIVCCLALARSNTTFVGAGLIENREEGLSFLSLPVVCLVGGFVPDGPNVMLNVVIGLRVVGAVVAGLSQVFRIELQPLWSGCLRTHVMCPERGCIHATNDGCPGRGTDWGRGDGIAVEKGGLRERVEVGSVGVGVPVTSKMRTVILGLEPENIGSIKGYEGR